MENQRYEAASKLFKTLFVLLKLGPVIQSPNPTDPVTLNQKREQILAHIEKIKVKIDDFSMEKIKTMLSQLQTAVNYVNKYDFENAHKYFQLIDEGHKVCYALAPNFGHKLLVSRVKLLATLASGFYFYPFECGSPINMQQIEANCQAVFDKFIQQPIVASTLKDEFEGRSILNVVKRRMSNDQPRNERHVVLNELNLLNWFLYDIFRTKATFSVFKSTVSMDLSHAKAVEFTVNINGTVGIINKIWVFRNKVSCILCHMCVEEL